MTPDLNPLWGLHESSPKPKLALSYKYLYSLPFGLLICLFSTQLHKIFEIGKKRMENAIPKSECTLE